MKSWGIRARVLFLALVPCASILVVLVGYFTYARIAEIDVLLAQQGAAIARQLAPGAEFALFANDRVALQRLTDAAASEANVASVRISDAAGNALAQSTVKGDSVSSSDTVAFAHAVSGTRLVAHDRVITADEDNWMRRAGGFTYGLLNGQLGRTYQNGHPGVTTMWVAMLTLGPDRMVQYADRVRGQLQKVAAEGKDEEKAEAAALLARMDGHTDYSVSVAVGGSS